MQVKAFLKYLHMSPRKVRLVVDNFRGLKAMEALEKLSFVKNRAARPLIKLINSAIANAEHNFSLDKNSLKIVVFKVDGGPVLKRYRPKALGRAALILRRTSHISIVLEGERLSPEAIKQKASASEEEQKISTVIPEAETEEISVKKSEKDFEVEKKVSRTKEPSFVRKFFRRKSI